jgi:hypothetical protein
VTASLLETIAAFRPGDVAPFAIGGGALGLATGVLLALRFWRTGFLRRPSALWRLASGAAALWMPLSFAAGWGAVGAVAGMAYLARAYAGSEQAGVSRSAAGAVDAMLEEIHRNVRGSGLGEEVFPEIARLASDAAGRGIRQGLAADPAYAEALDVSRDRREALLREFFAGEVRAAAESGAAGPSPDAEALCEAVRPLLARAVEGGAATRIVREASMETFRPMLFWAVALWAFLLSPCLLEDLLHVLFRAAPRPPGLGGPGSRGRRGGTAPDIYRIFFDN